MKLTVTFKNKCIFSCIVIDSSKHFELFRFHTQRYKHSSEKNTAHCLRACNVVDVNTAFQNTFFFLYRKLFSGLMCGFDRLDFSFTDNHLVLPFSQ